MGAFPTDNLSINHKNQSGATSFFLSDEFGKMEPMKTFDSSNQWEKNLALVFFKFRIHHFFSNYLLLWGKCVWLLLQFS
jgi:hypothetical protein